MHPATVSTDGEVGSSMGNGYVLGTSVLGSGTQDPDLAHGRPDEITCLRAAFHELYTGIRAQARRRCATTLCGPVREGGEQQTFVLIAQRVREVILHHATGEHGARSAARRRPGVRFEPVRVAAEVACVDTLELDTEIG